MPISTLPNTTPAPYATSDLLVIHVCEKILSDPYLLFLVMVTMFIFQLTMKTDDDKGQQVMAKWIFLDAQKSIFTK